MSCIAVHPRRTPERILIDPAHCEGPTTDRAHAPMPLGRMGRRLTAINAMPPDKCPLNQLVQRRTPSGYVTAITLTSNDSSMQWSIGAGSDLVSFSGSGSSAVVTSKGMSESSNDVQIVATTTAGGHNTHDLTVRAPKSLMGLGYSPTCPHALHGFLTLVLYLIRDHLDQPLPHPVPVSEQFTSSWVTVWTNHDWGSPVSAKRD